jgi:hypothetical protein
LIILTFAVQHHPSPLPAWPRPTDLFELSCAALNLNDNEHDERRDAKANMAFSVDRVGALGLHAFFVFSNYGMFANAQERAQNLLALALKHSQLVRITFSSSYSKGSYGIAKQIGLHRDPKRWGMSDDEAQMVLHTHLTGEFILTKIIFVP